MRNRKYRKKTKSKRLKAKADRIWSQIIRSKGFCEARELEGCLGVLNAAHIIKRDATPLRHDLENGICLCVKHHYWFDKGIAMEVSEWFNRKFPDRWKKLKEKDYLSVGTNKVDYEEVLDKLKKELDNIDI